MDEKIEVVLGDNRWEWTKAAFVYTIEARKFQRKCKAQGCKAVDLAVRFNIGAEVSKKLDDGALLFVPNLCGSL